MLCRTQPVENNGNTRDSGKVARQRKSVLVLWNMKQSNQKQALKWRKTKIVATLGPASDSEKMITRLIQAGVDVFRLNMSHGDHRGHRRVFKRIRKIAGEQSRHIAILMDLCGPKIRTGRFEAGQITLKQNATVIVSCTETMGRDGVIVSQYKRLYRDIAVGDRILLDDGNIELKAVAVDGKAIQCKVVYGGVLKDHKGINLPDTRVSVSSFTDKDRDDVSLAMSLGADFVALSFVREAKDIRQLKTFMKKQGRPIAVISKIEKPEAIANIDEIMAESYGIMIARGDLGIELPAEQVPLIQKRLIDHARTWHRPVIVATQMMESMISQARPTRAEVGDVANAALSSADAVMLSAETAAGKYPYKAVRTMDSILREIEKEQWRNKVYGTRTDELKQVGASAGGASTRIAVAHAATSLANELLLKAILVPTRSGVTASVVSSVRPAVLLMGLSSEAATCRRLALHWGVVPSVIDEVVARNWKSMVKQVCRQCAVTTAGNKVLLVSGFHDDPGMSEPVLKIITA